MSPTGAVNIPTTIGASMPDSVPIVFVMPNSSPENLQHVLSATSLYRTLYQYDNCKIEIEVQLHLLKVELRPMNKNISIEQRHRVDKDNTFVEPTFVLY